LDSFGKADRCLRRPSNGLERVFFPSFQIPEHFISVLHAEEFADPAVHFPYPDDFRKAPTPLSVNTQRARHVDSDRAVEPQVSNADGPFDHHSFEPRLNYIVMPTACGLPHPSVPKLHHVTFVRLNMVNQHCDSGNAYRLTSEAQGM
jgi:hypothetical protein